MSQGLNLAGTVVVVGRQNLKLTGVDRRLTSLTEFFILCHAVNLPQGAEERLIKSHEADQMTTPRPKVPGVNGTCDIVSVVYLPAC